MKKRDSYFDNAKFFLIFFVVFGHLIQSYIQHQDSIYALYKTIYVFHMPAFILISGYFAKGFRKKGYTVNLIKKLLVPYIIFQGVYALFYYYILNYQTIHLDPLDPQWSLWFLLSLFFWNLLLRPFSKFKPFIGLTIAFSLGIIVGYFDFISNYLSLSRTFVFFPFFLLGFHLARDQMKVNTNIIMRSLSVMIFSTVFLFFYFNHEVDYQWLLGSKPYSEMEHVSYISALKRGYIYILSIITTFSFLILVPRKKYFFTSVGKYTLYVYLLHGFFVKTFRSSQLTELLPDVQAIWLLAVVSLILTFLLTNKIVLSFVQPFVEMQYTQLKHLLAQLKRMSYKLQR